MPDQEDSNPVPHTHHYVLKGSGLSCWAECDVEVPRFARRGDAMAVDLYVCGEKLNEGNGAIVGSRSKIEASLRGRTVENGASNHDTSLHSDAQLCTPEQAR